MKQNKEQFPNEKDRLLLASLESEARISFAALGERIGLSKTPCWNKVRDMEQQGVILGYSARLDPTALGLNIRALVHVVVDFHQYQQFEQAIIDHPQVRACHAVTGDFDYVLEVLEKDMQTFDHMLRADLSRLPGVQRFTTSISTRMVKSDGPYGKMI